MKKSLKRMLPLLALAAFMWTGCSEDDELANKPELPTISVSEPTLNADKTKVEVTVTPSEETEKWYWKCEEKGKTEVGYTTVTGKEIAKLEIPISMDLTYVFTAYAENVTGKSGVLSKEFGFKYGDHMAELVEFEIKNVSAYSMDVDVRKSAKCAKYVIAAIRKQDAGESPIYVEDEFIESAKLSLNPDEDYPRQPYNWSDADKATFNELTLNRNTTADKDISESEGVRFEPGAVYVIALYALDTEGNAKVYTEEVPVPEPTLTGNVAVTITVPEDKITITSFDVTFSAGDKCSKSIVGMAPVAEFTAGTAGGSGFDGMTDTQICAKILSFGATLPKAYTEPFTVTFSGNDPKTAYVAYAIPIDNEGKIGKIAYKKVTTASPVFDGIGNITSVTIPEQTDINKLAITINVDNNTKSIRLLCLPNNAHTVASSNLEWSMSDKQFEGRYWTEYTVADLEKLKTLDNDGGLSITEPGGYYYLKAVAVDADGKLSKIVNLVKMAGKGDQGIQTKAEEVEGPKPADLTGTGELTLTLESEIEEEGGNLYKFKLKIEKGANTQKVYMLKHGNGEARPMENNIKNLVMAEDFFNNFTSTATPTGAISVVEFEGDSAIIESECYYAYDGNYGGDARIFVTLDGNGKCKIADYYICGYGTKNNPKK